MRFSLNVIAVIFITLVVFTYGVAGEVFAINSAVAYLSTFMVIGLSFYGYYRQAKEQQGEVINTDYDKRFEYDKFHGDTHDLLDEEEKEVANKEEENKKFSLANLASGSKIFFSLYRIVAYIILVTALMVLIDKNLFDAWGYLFGVFGSTVAILVIMIRLRKTIS